MTGFTDVTVGSTYRWTPNKNGVTVDGDADMTGWDCAMVLNGPLKSTPVATTYVVPATNAALGLFFRDGMTTDLPLAGVWEVTFIFTRASIDIAIPPIRFDVKPRRHTT